MTALSQYTRLESPAVWHESPESQRRDVYVSLGEATLVIKDQADTALTHWSLPAVVRIGMGQNPAIFAPGEQDDERLELSDPDMIEALDRIRRVLARGEPHRGRLRLLVLAGVLIAVGALAVFWLPGALVGHTARALPEATRQDIGRRLVIALTPYTGQTCRDPAGQAALAELQQRLFGQAPWDLRIVETGHSAIALPGGILLAGRGLMQGRDSPDAIAGHIVAAATRTAVSDPLHWLLDRAGPWETFRMLTTGHISDAVLSDAAKGLALAEGLPELEAPSVLTRFEAIGLSSRNYGMTADAAGEAWLEVIEGDPYPGGTPAPLLSDAAWLRLQAICD